MGIWLVNIAANYIPLFIYAVLITKGDTVKEEGQPELARSKRYGIEQVIILVPVLVIPLEERDYSLKACYLCQVMIIQLFLEGIDE